MEANQHQKRGFAVYPEPAGCPHCGISLPRSLFFTKLPFVHRKAGCCGGMYQIHGGREFLTSAFFGLAWSICFSLGWLGFVSWTVAACVLAGVFSFAYLLSPYLIRVEKADVGAGASRGAKMGRAALMRGSRRARTAQAETTEAVADAWEPRRTELLREPAGS